MSNQGARQASVRAVTGTAFTYEGDWHALFDMAGIPAGTFNERMLAWINDYLGTSYTELNGAMAAFAQDQGYSDWNSMGAFDAAGLKPLEFISTVNYQADSNSQVGSFTNFAIHEPFYIGQDSKSLVLSFLNYYCSESAEAGTGNAYTVESCAIYKDGSATVYPVTFSGAYSKTILNDDFDIQADPVVVSAIKGEKWWRKLIVSIPVQNQRLPFVFAGVGAASSVTSKQLHRYNPANTTVSATNATGVFTASGTALDSGYNFLWFGGVNILGNPVVGGKARVFIGDSICAGINDSPPSILPHGKGFFQRGSNMGAELNPSHNIGISGIRTDSFVARTRWQRYLQYCRHAALMTNTNDNTQGATLAQLQSRITSLCSIIRGAGIPKIVASKLIALTTGTWTTAGGQTPDANWVFPGKAYDYNDWMETQVGTLFDGLITLDALRDASAVNLWKGQTPAVTADGIHPNATGFALVEDEAKSVMDAVFI